MVTNGINQTSDQYFKHKCNTHTQNKPPVSVLIHFFSSSHVVLKAHYVVLGRDVKDLDWLNKMNRLFITE